MATYKAVVLQGGRHLKEDGRYSGPYPFSFLGSHQGNQSV